MQRISELGAMHGVRYVSKNLSILNQCIVGGVRTALRTPPQKDFGFAPSLRRRSPSGRTRRADGGSRRLRRFTRRQSLPHGEELRPWLLLEHVEALAQVVDLEVIGAD